MSQWSPLAAPPLTEAQQSLLLEKICQFSLGNGLVMYPPGFIVTNAEIAPVTLFPTPFPKDSFERAVLVQKLFNSLYALVVSQKLWLLQVSEGLAAHDKEFTGRLYETYMKSVQLGGGKLTQQLTLGLFRSDYMYDHIQHSIKQIEFNTIASSFGGLSTKVCQAHEYLNKSGTYKPGEKYYGDNIAVSDSLKKLADGLAHANKTYAENSGTPATPVILFIVQDKERNCFDQRLIEYSLVEHHSVMSYRCTLEAAKDITYLADGFLRIKATSEEVGVVYYRSGYGPLDYENDPELTWDNRLYLETSKAIKCPSLLTQLSGTKKVQQALTDPETILSFIPKLSKSELQELTDTFVKIYPLDDSSDGNLAKELAFELPEKFVLKPQREGGGNNIYKEKIPEFLKSIDESEWGAYILMELIFPPTYNSKILRLGQVLEEHIILELGIFGTILFNEDTGEIFGNENAGHLLRSKVSSSNEGGVAAGFGCLDNVYLQ